MDWIGRSTVVDDAKNATGLIDSAIAWILATPWPVPAALATILTGLLIYLNWPRETFFRHVVLTQEEYDALEVKDKDTFYYIPEKVPDTEGLNSTSSFDNQSPQDTAPETQR